MTLLFPNESRSYDSRRHGVRFWGHDSALEIFFLVEVAAFVGPDAGHEPSEADCLRAFDAALGRIHAAARKAYDRGHKDSYVLTAKDF